MTFTEKFKPLLVSPLPPCSVRSHMLVHMIRQVGLLFALPLSSPASHRRDR